MLCSFMLSAECVAAIIGAESAGFAFGIWMQENSEFFAALLANEHSARLSLAWSTAVVADNKSIIDLRTASAFAGFHGCFPSKK